MKKIISALIGLLVIGSIATAGYFYNQNRTTQELLKDPTAATKEEIKTVTTALSKFMDLPTDEEPTIATVLDKEKVKDQPFFARAENGDKVIIYTKSGKAILFRPSTGRIIDIAPINLGQTQTEVNVIILNGTKTVGLAKTFSAYIKTQATNVSVLSEDSANKNDYARSVVVDVTGKKADLAKQMATLIDGDVATLPEGEIVPEIAGKTVDLLVIVGANVKMPVATPTVSQTTPTPTPETTPAPTE